MGAGISGVGVGLVTGGLVLVYAGLRDVTPLAALREVTSGSPPSIAPKTSGLAEAVLTGSGTVGGGFFPTAPSSGAGGLASAARKYIGVPYRWGGKNPATGLDCSGLVVVAFRDIGVTDCPGTSSTIMAWRKLHKVAGAPSPNDLLWWPGHIAIASSATTMIEAPSAGKTVRERDIWRKPALVLRYAVTSIRSPGGAIAS